MDTVNPHLHRDWALPGGMGYSAVLTAPAPRPPPRPKVLRPAAVLLLVPAPAALRAPPPPSPSPPTHTQHTHLRTHEPWAAHRPIARSVGDGARLGSHGAAGGARSYAQPRACRCGTRAGAASGRGPRLPQVPQCTSEGHWLSAPADNCSSLRPVIPQGRESRRRCGRGEPQSWRRCGSGEPQSWRRCGSG